MSENAELLKICENCYELMRDLELIRESVVGPLDLDFFRGAIWLYYNRFFRLAKRLENLSEKINNLEDGE